MSEIPKVLVTRQLPGGAIARLSARTRCRVWSGEAQPTSEELCAALSGCDGLLCLLTDRIDSEILAAAENLRVVSSCSVGVDHIDLSAANARGIPIGHTPGVLAETTADLTFGLLLSAARRIPEADRFVRDRGWIPTQRWRPDMLLGRDIHGASLGVVGLGAIGCAVARRAHGFGMRVLGWSRSGRSVEGVEGVSFDTLLAESDFVTLHVAYSPETHHLLDAAAIARMKPGALLVNTSRGGIVDEGALARALRDGQLSAAALDVFEREPLPPDDPLLSLENVVLTPHIGSASIRTRSRMADLAVDNLLAGLEGRPLPNCANPEVSAQVRG